MRLSVSACPGRTGAKEAHFWRASPREQRLGEGEKPTTAPVQADREGKTLAHRGSRLGSECREAKGSWGHQDPLARKASWRWGVAACVAPLRTGARRSPGVGDRGRWQKDPRLPPGLRTQRPLR